MPKLLSFCAMLALVLPSFVAAQDIETARIADGLDRPVFATSPPGDTSRLFIVEQHTGEIKIMNLGDFSINATPFLTVGSLSTGNEQGLLGLAFHPDYATNGQFFINRTDSSGDTQVDRYQVSANPNIATPTPTNVLSIDQPQSNHNGGWIGFGNDDFLYIASGDGGGGDDNDGGHTTGIGNGQDITSNLLGKMLRIDVDSTGLGNYGIPQGNPFVDVTGDDEIWSYGLRNPYRASFDRQTGDLYIGDVGQNAKEEIDFQPSTSIGGENYGWRLREGTIPTPTGGVGGPAPPGAIDPIYDYDHGGGPLEGNVVTGGYVYRGPISELDGHYVFADFGSQRIWSLVFDGSDPATFDGTNFTNFTDRTSQFVPNVSAIQDISSFAEDELGNLYILDLGEFTDPVAGGEIFKVIVDFPGDANLDFSVGAPDYTLWADNFGLMGAGVRGDNSEDGAVGPEDYTIWANNFGMGLSSPDSSTQALLDEPAVSPGGGLAERVAPNAVPESSTASMLVIAVFAMLACTRRRPMRAS